MIVSKEEFVKRIYAKILAKNVFLEKLPFNMNTLLKTNETAEWVAHMVLEDVVLLNAGKWEKLKQHLANPPLDFYKDVFDGDTGEYIKREPIPKATLRTHQANLILDLQKVMKWFEELEKMVNENE